MNPMIVLTRKRTRSPGLIANLADGLKMQDLVSLIALSHREGLGWENARLSLCWIVSSMAQWRMPGQKSAKKRCAMQKTNFANASKVKTK